MADAIGKDLAIFDEAKRNQSRRQFESWEMEVHDRIQSEVLRQINERSYQRINETRRKHYQDFLDITNVKPALFLDTIIESEYDPLVPNRDCIQVRPGVVNDPVKRTLTKRFEENGGGDGSGGGSNRRITTLNGLRSMLATSSISGSGSGSGSGLVNPRTQLPFAVTREVLDTREWATGKIESTPHGIFSKMMNKQRPNDGEREKSQTYDSHIHLDHYNVQKGKEVLLKEYPKGKRTFHKPERNPISHDFPDVDGK